MNQSILKPGASYELDTGDTGIDVKKMRNAVLVATTLTVILFAYYLISGQTDEIDGLWVNGVVMFFGVFGYLLFAARKSCSKHPKTSTLN